MTDSNLRNIRHRTVSAATDEELDAEIETAVAEILQINARATWIDTRITATADTVFATIIWS